MSDSYIQIPTDGTGKKVRTTSGTVGSDTVHTHWFIPSDSSLNELTLDTGGQQGAKVHIVGDGDKYCRGVTARDSPVSTLEPVVMGGRGSASAPSAVSTDGDVVDAWLDKSGRTQINGDSSMTPILASGSSADAATDSGNPVKIGLIGRQTNRTAVSDGQRVNAMGDDLGRQVMVLNQVRDLVTQNTTTISSSTSETTILSAVASTYLDLVAITLCNTSATATRVDIRDDTAGTIRMAFYLPAGDMRGMVLQVPLPQTATNKNWTAQCSASVADVRIWIQAVKNV